MLIKLYTQNNCPYCVTLIEKLANWGISFEVVNISSSPDAKAFLKSRGHRMVPVLYINNEFWINEGIDTNAFTEQTFYDRLDVMLETTLPEKITEMLEKHDDTSDQKSISSASPRLQDAVDAVSHYSGTSLYLNKSENGVKLMQRTFASLGGNAEHDVVVENLLDDEIEWCENNGIHERN